MRFCLSLISCLFLASFVSVSGADVKSTAPASLAGKAFSIVLKSGDDKKKEEKDNLVFTATDGDATACHKWGFSFGPVTYTAKGDGVAFAFTTKSEKEGTIAWDGVATGTKIEGTMTWTKKDGKISKSEFLGTEESAKKEDKAVKKEEHMEEKKAEEKKDAKKVEEKK